MFEFTGYAKTLTELPTGARVASNHTESALLGTVVGSHKESVVIHWDNGASSVKPATQGVWTIEESTRPEWTTPDDFDGPEDYAHAVDEWELSHSTYCDAHYPLILDGYRLWCRLDAGHTGNHECEASDEAWSGSTYEWADQPECYTTF